MAMWIAPREMRVRSRHLTTSPSLNTLTRTSPGLGSRPQCSGLSARDISCTGLLCTELATRGRQNISREQESVVLFRCLCEIPCLKELVHFVMPPSPEGMMIVLTLELFVG